MEQMPKIINGGIAVDDRGTLTFMNDFNFEGVKRFYRVQNFKQGFIRAWHGHKIEGKYVFVVKGSALVGAVDMATEETFKWTLSEKSPKILWIPPGYANGWMNLEEDTVILFFSTATMEEAKTDDYRFPYDKWNIWNIEYR